MIQSNLAFFENHLSRTTTGAETVALTDQQRLRALEAIAAKLLQAPKTFVLPVHSR